jgi:hypothetical protein
MTDQFDNFQLDPNTIGNDWVFSGDEIHANRAPGTKISNFNYYFAGARMSQDRTKTVFDFKNEQNPERTIGAGFSGWGVDWSLFNYNPYSKTNPNFKVYNDYLQIMGLGNIDVESEDVMDKKEVDAAGMLAYRNYPTEGYNSFGKKGDKRWSWQGNSWVPGN